MNEELIKREVARQLEEQSQTPPNHFRNELISLGGGAAGAGLGLLAINPYEEIKQGSQIKRHNKFVDQLQNEVSAFRALKEIRDGVSTFDDFGPAAPVLREMFESNADLLQDDAALNDLIRTPVPARIERLEDARIPNLDPSRVQELKQHKRHLRMEQLKRMAPGRGVLDNFADAVKHPAVAIGGLAGMAGSYYMMDQLDKKKHTQE